jgi:hypothetical protein
VTEAHTAEPWPTDLLTIRTEPVVEADAGEQPVFPHSIIPGGAGDGDALRSAIDADPVVRAHYANFDVGKVRVVRLAEPRVAYVSYRLGNHVFWTRRPLLLKANETLLTDGVHYARTRCGNQLAVAPGAISSAEPSPELLDTPMPIARGARVFPAITLPRSGGARSMLEPGMTESTFGGAGVRVGHVQPETVLTRLAPRPEFFASSVGLTVPPPSRAGPDDPDDPPSHMDDPPRRTLDDPPARQVPEPGLTLLMLGGGAMWAHRRRQQPQA